MIMTGNSARPFSLVNVAKPPQTPAIANLPERQDNNVREANRKLRSGELFNEWPPDTGRRVSGARERCQQPYDNSNNARIFYHLP